MPLPGCFSSASALHAERPKLGRCSHRPDRAGEAIILLQQKRVLIAPQLKLQLLACACRKAQAERLLAEAKAAAAAAAKAGKAGKGGDKGSLQQQQQKAQAQQQQRQPGQPDPRLRWDLLAVKAYIMLT